MPRLVDIDGLGSAESRHGCSDGANPSSVSINHSRSNRRSLNKTQLLGSLCRQAPSDRLASGEYEAVLARSATELLEIALDLFAGVT
jgi:hypothetical protein